jgi:hypothetical protein
MCCYLPTGSKVSITRRKHRCSRRLTANLPPILSKAAARSSHKTVKNNHVSTGAIFTNWTTNNCIERKRYREPKIPSRRFWAVHVVIIRVLNTEGSLKVPRPLQEGKTSQHRILSLSEAVNSLHAPKNMKTRPYTESLSSVP